MFPLGSVLFPTMVLPLRIFEPRYHALIQACLAGEPEFGVVLIERGFEVGGGDQRHVIGTVARIARVQDAGAMLFVDTFGTRRIRVEEWLPDDPYPRALVSDYPDDVDIYAGTDNGDDWHSTIRNLRRFLAVTSEAGYDVAPATTELSDDPLVASYQAATLLPVGPFDQQRILSAPSITDRFRLIDEAITDGLEILES